MYTKKNVGITNEEKAFLRSGGGAIYSNTK